MKSFISERFKSFKFAFSGIKCAFLQPNFKIQCVLGLFSVFFGVFLKIAVFEWFVVLLCTASVLASELFNSSIEELADTLHPNYSPGIKKTKDMVAAAALIVSVCSFLIGLFIFIPKLYLLFS